MFMFRLLILGWRGRGNHTDTGASLATEKRGNVGGEYAVWHYKPN